MSEARELEAAKKPILAALKAGDWQQFRRFCCPSVSIEEYWHLYKDDLSRDHQASAYQGFLFSRQASSDPTRDYAIVNGIRVLANGSLSPEERIVFRNFCKQVNITLSVPNDWISVDTESAGAEYKPLCGTAITGKVASNLHWWIQLERYRSEWKVRRLVLEGH